MPDPEAVLTELSRVTGSAAFVGSVRLKKLLVYLVEEALAGRAESLRGETIARDFFQRGNAFDAVADPIVRVEMSKLRRALSGVYAPRRVGALRIELPVGTYVPRFVTDADQPVSRTRPAERRAWIEGGPVVAVRPLTGADGGALSASLGHEIAERLAALLARLPYVHVVGPLSNAELEGGYLIAGSVRCSLGACRVIVSLHEVDGHVVWGETYNPPCDESGAPVIGGEFYEILFTQLFDFLGGALNHAECLALRKAGRPAQTVYEVMLNFRAWFMRFERRDYVEARAAGESVVQAESGPASVLGLLACTHAFASWTRWGDAGSPAAAAAFADKAMAADPMVMVAHVAAALVAMDAGDSARMRRAAERVTAIGTMPAMGGLLLAIAGEWERGTAMVRRASDVQVQLPGWFHHAPFLDAYRRGDYPAALVEAQRIATPELAWDPLDRAAVLGKLGRVEEARVAAKELSAILPAFAQDPRGHVNRLVPDPRLVAALLEGLAIAGFELAR